MTEQRDSIFIGRGEEARFLDLRLANRHGLIAGATGTGKTVTLQILAEGFSAQGVPVFMADVKGDLSGVAAAGVSKPFLLKRAEQIGLDSYAFGANPTIFWDLFGEQGHPIRTTVSEMGPLLLARLLGLNEVQSGVLDIAFKVADDEGLLLLDLKDLRAMLGFVSDQAKELSTSYGRVSKASVGAIQRALLRIEQQGAEQFFGEPALDLRDMMRVDRKGRGYLNVLAADRLIESPRLYATFLLWLLSELFEELPEVGDPEKPELIFFFDEAHLLFDDAPKALLDKVAQVIRLIRSKGVGVYFVTQNPRDIPEEVLAQLGNRIQHALRAYTPSERKAVRAAADSFRPNPRFDSETVITELGVGEALVSTLGAKGVPSVVERTLIRPPSSRLGPITKKERKAVIAESPLGARYDTAIDRDSAYERLQRMAEEAAERAETAAPAKTRSSSRKSSRQTPTEALVTSFARSLGTQIGRALLRGVLGTLSKGR